MWSSRPSLASLRSLSDWSCAAEEAAGALGADTSIVTDRQHNMVKEIVRAHGTWDKALDERLTKWRIVTEGNLSQDAICRYFFLKATGLNEWEFRQIGHLDARADALDELVDAEIRATLLRRWLS